MQAKTLSRFFAQRAALLALLSVALSAIFLVAPWTSRGAAAGAAGVVTIEAEDLYWSYDEGGGPIYATTVGCEYFTSGGKAVDGLDYPGDWIEINFSVPEPIMFRDSLRSAGDVGLRRKYIIEFRALQGQSPAPAPDTLTTPLGRGIT